MSLAMKQSILFATLGLVALGASAQEVGQVLSSTPVIQQVAVPRTYCNQPGYYSQPQTSGAGGLMGAIAGGGIGSQIGHGGGTAAAVALGVIGGAILGNQIEANGARQAYAQPACGTETTYENRTVGYNVTYEYAGRQYTMQMPYDPGPTVQLQVTPYASNVPQQGSAPVYAPPVAQPAVVAQSGVVVQQPAPIVYQAYPAYPAYPVYAPYPVYRPYFPIGISLGYSFHGGHRHRR
jgi:uncharacterized protein YcfJ